MRRTLGTLAPRAAVIAIYAFLLAPLLVVVGVSFDPTDAFRFPPPGLSVRWYEAFFANEAFVDAFFRVSLAVASVVSLIATLVGGLAAIGLVRFRFRGRTAVETAFIAPIVVPEVLLGAALYIFYTRIHLRATLVALILGHVLIAVPYVVRTVSAGLAGVSLSLEEAAMSLGASRIQAFCKVTLPLIRSSVLSGAAFAFIISLSDINLALFITGPETVTLPLHIFSQVTWQSDPTIAAASTVQIATIATLLGLVQRFFRLRVAL
jgi:putative spermidine/putrescine transport system permease protein